MTDIISTASHNTSADVYATVAAGYPLASGDAKAIASWYQSPVANGAVLAAFASGQAVEVDDLYDAALYELRDIAADTPAYQVAALSALVEWARVRKQS